MGSVIRAGTLDKQIIIQSSIETKQTDNSIEQVWSSIKQTRASIKPIQGDEFFINKSMTNDVDHYIIIRKPNVKITAADRIVYKEKVFNIEYVLNVDERNTHLMFLAKKRESSDIVFARCDWLLEDGFSLLAEDGSYLILEGCA